MAKATKKREEALRRYDRQHAYTPGDAMELVKTLASANFDESVDAAFQLGVLRRAGRQLG